ncbi:MAG: 30S ribosomal protein S3 [Spirochaetaceae bacterium]|nr:30S ribosomal protein S3 [Spirochaetaceae bacterium]MBP5329319.1 30S ribosomal protein S3 [Spirochaetaceae bacterium]
MGQKVNPIGLRLGINKTWQSRWYADPREYADSLHEDLKIRKLIAALPECKNADIAEVEIVRHPQRVTIVIHTARPGVIIGVKGATIEAIGAEIQKSVSKKVQIKIKEIKRAETNASLVAQNIAKQLVARGSFRKCFRQASSSAMKAGAQGIKIRLSGRLGGAEMSRTEEHKDGRVPLHTLRADIDYGFAEALTTFGKIGVKVWIFNGMNYGRDLNDDANQLVKKRRERTEKSSSVKAEKAEKSEKTEKAEKTEKSERKERAPRAEKSSRS